MREYEERCKRQARGLKSDALLTGLKGYGIDHRVASLVHEVTRSYMLVKFPLEPSDIPSVVLRIQERDLLDDIELELHARFGLDLKIPDEYVVKSALELAEFIQKHFSDAG